MQVNIRPAVAGEADLLSELVFRSKASWGYDEEFMDAGRAELTISEQSLREDKVWVAEDAGQVLGCLRLKLHPDYIWLEDLFIDPKYFGQGLGTMLWIFTLRFATESGYNEIRLEADPNARVFYEHLGAVTTGWRESKILAGRMLPLMSFQVRKRAV